MGQSYGGGEDDGAAGDARRGGARQRAGRLGPATGPRMRRLQRLDVGGVAAPANHAAAAAT
jgi:hypothetical protein